MTKNIKKKEERFDVEAEIVLVIKQAYLLHCTRICAKYCTSCIKH